MEESDTIVTLIGTKLAKVNNEFIFRGGAKDCEVCKLNRTCLSLNVGSRYRIKNLRNGGKLECLVHDSGVCAVEVVEEPMVIGIESRKAIRGSTLVYEPLICNVSHCANYALCRPIGLKRGDKLTLLNVVGDISELCEKGYILKITEVKR